MTAIQHRSAKVRRSFPGSWSVQTNESTGDPYWPFRVTFLGGFSTHAEAMAEALNRVGLTPSNPEPMEAP